jgi:hypothetical protein
MSQMPGIMSKMPPLPVSVDEKLASYVLPGAPMVNFFCFDPINVLMICTLLVHSLLGI